MDKNGDTEGRLWTQFAKTCHSLHAVPCWDIDKGHYHQTVSSEAQRSWKEVTNINSEVLEQLLCSLPGVHQDRLALLCLFLSLRLVIIVFIICLLSFFFVSFSISYLIHFMSLSFLASWLLFILPISKNVSYSWKLDILYCSMCILSFYHDVPPSRKMSGVGAIFSFDIFEFTQCTNLLPLKLIIKEFVPF